MVASFTDNNTAKKMFSPDLKPCKMGFLGSFNFTFQVISERKMNFLEGHILNKHMSNGRDRM